MSYRTILHNFISYNLNTKLIIEISLFNRLMMELYCHPLSGKCAQSWSSILGGNRKNKVIKYKKYEMKEKNEIFESVTLGYHLISSSKYLYVLKQVSVCCRC